MQIYLILIKLADNAKPTSEKWIAIRTWATNFVKKLKIVGQLTKAHNKNYA